jgi:hypothetical protein
MAAPQWPFTSLKKKLPDADADMALRQCQPTTQACTEKKRLTVSI